MHRTLIHAIRPPHQKVRNIDYEGVGEVRSDVPRTTWLEDFETGGAGGEEQGEAFVVGVGA